jgi:hypothetical protein
MIFIFVVLKSQVAPLIVKADLKHLTKVYTGGESDFLCSLKIMGVPWYRLAGLVIGGMQ